MKKIFFILLVLFVWVSAGNVSAQVLQNPELRSGVYLTISFHNNSQTKLSRSCQITNPTTGEYFYNKTGSVPANGSYVDPTRLLLGANRSYIVRGITGGTFVQENAMFKLGARGIRIERDAIVSFPRIVFY